MPIFNEDIELKRVTGLDAEIKKKAEELIEVGPDEPRAMREGTMFFLFRDYWLLSHNDGFGFWCVESVDGTDLPAKLQGRFTSRNLAMDAVLRWGDPEQQERGRVILEAKNTKLKQDIARGAKVNSPHERKELPLRAIKDSLNRKSRLTATADLRSSKKNTDSSAEDKPTVME